MYIQQKTYLLRWITDLYGKYPWTVPLKDEKRWNNYKSMLNFLGRIKP